MPEVIGDGGELVDPDDVDGWIAAIELILTDAQRREALIAAGRSRAAHFSAERAAHALLAAYRLSAEVSHK